jgi:peptidoglycan/LPS O-acetylase OafA/YrhL
MGANETTTIRPGGHRLPELDGLRAWAITVVVFGHLGLSLFVGGGVGVDLFFVLSGFLITHLLLREYDRRKKIDLLAFYRRRAWRLLPALFAMLIVVDVATWIQNPEGGLLRANLIGSLWAAGFVANWPQEWIGSYIHLWSLGIEEQYYILWAPVVILLVPKLNRSRAAVVLVALAVLDIVLRNWLYLGGAIGPTALNNATYSHVYALLIGSALAMALTREGRVAIPPWSRWLGWLSLPAMILLTIRVATTYSHDPVFSLWVVTPLSTLASAVLVGGGRGRRRFVDRGPATGAGGLVGANLLLAVPVAPAGLRSHGLHGLGAETHVLVRLHQAGPFGGACRGVLPSHRATVAATLRPQGLHGSQGRASARLCAGLSRNWNPRLKVRAWVPPAEKSARQRAPSAAT